MLFTFLTVSKLHLCSNLLYRIVQHLAKHPSPWLCPISSYTLCLTLLRRLQIRERPLTALAR